MQALKPRAGIKCHFYVTRLIRNTAGILYMNFITLEEKNNQLDLKTELTIAISRSTSVFKHFKVITMQNIVKMQDSSNTCNHC